MNDMILKDGRMPTSTPEEQGIPSHAILWFLDQVEREHLDLHSLQIVRNGVLVADMVAAPFTRDSFHRIYSAAKGLVATAILFTVQDGLYQLDEVVLPHIPAQWLPDNLDPRWKKLTLYHLLTMNTGHSQDTLFKMWGGSDCWIKTFFEVKPAYEPGTYFCYDMGAQYVMNELIRLATGKDTGQYLNEKLFDKLGIEYQNQYTEPEGLFFSSTIQLKPDGLTKLSQFYLQGGSWEGKQLLDSKLAKLLGERQGPSRHYEYVRSGQFDNLGGYGLHMWRNDLGGYRFAGGQGQLGIIIPEENLVISMLAAEHRSSRLINLIFEALYSEMYRRPVEAAPVLQAELNRRLKQYNLAPRNVSDTSSLMDTISGKVYQLEQNTLRADTISFQFTPDQAVITLGYSDHTSRQITCGLRGEWKESQEGFFLMKTSPQKIADLDLIFGYDPNIVMFSGGWNGYNRFIFSMRSAALLCEFLFQFEFNGPDMTITLPFNDYLPRTECRDSKFVPPKIQLLGHVCS